MQNRKKKRTIHKDRKKIRRLFSGQAAVSSYGNNLSQPFIPYYLTRLGASVQQLGIFQALQNLFPNILQLPWGYVSDRMKRRIPFVVVGTVVASLILFSIAFMSNITILILVLSISAIIASMGAPAWSALMGDKIKHKHRGKHFSQFANYALVAGLLGTITVFFIFSTRSSSDITAYKWLFIGGAIIGLASLIFVIPMKDKAQNGQVVKILRPSQLDKDFKYFLLVMGIYNFFMSMGWPLFYISQAKVLGASNVEIAINTFVGIAATIAFQPLVGKFIDRTGPTWLITASRFMFIFVPFIYAFATSMAQIYVLNIIIGFAVAISNVAFSAYILDISPPEAKAEYFAYNNLVGGVAGFMGSIFAGYLAAYFQTIWPLATAFLLVYMICGFGRVVSSFLFLKLKNPKKYPSTPRQLAAAYRERIRWNWRRP